MMWSVYVASIWQQEWYILRHIIYNLALACTCSGPCIVKYKDLAARPGLQTSRRWSKISEFLLGYTADFSTTIYICLKLRLLCTFHHKTTSKHPRIQEFWLYFAKKSVTPDKNGESAPTQLAPPVPGQAEASRLFWNTMLAIKRRQIN